MPTFTVITLVGDEFHVTQHRYDTPERALVDNIGRLPFDDGSEPLDEELDWLVNVAEGRSKVSLDGFHRRFHGTWLWLEGQEHVPPYRSWVVQTDVRSGEPTAEEHASAQPVAVPVLHCADMDAALALYCGVLAATVSWRDRVGNPAYASIRWRGHELHLSSHVGDGVAGAAVYLRIADVDALFAELLARGFAPPGHLGPVYASPTDQTWGMREFYVRDPDGNSLRFAASIGT
jgi:uncharacterized glyoxalase superfamily protein PhnB